MQIEPKPNKKPIYHELFSPESKSLVIMVGVSDEIIERVLRFDYDRLKIDFGDWNDLSFLHGNEKKIKKLFIGSENCDWSVINEFYNLEELVIGGWLKTKLSFTKFTKLKVLDTYWNEGYTNDIYDLPMLEKLSITGGNFISLKNFATYKSLKELEIVDSYKLESCDGICELKKLEKISFYGMRKLNDVNALGKLANLEMLILKGCNSLNHLRGLGESNSIRRLFLERCKKLEGYDFLKGRISKTLKILWLIDLKIGSLRVLSELSNLTHLNLTGSKVVDGDLTILFNLKELKSVMLKNSRNFHPSAKEVEAFLELKKIINHKS